MKLCSACEPFCAWMPTCERAASAVAEGPVALGVVPAVVPVVEAWVVEPDCVSWPASQLPTVAAGPMNMRDLRCKAVTCYQAKCGPWRASAGGGFPRDKA